MAPPWRPRLVWGRLFWFLLLLVGPEEGARAKDIQPKDIIHSIINDFLTTKPSCKQAISYLLQTRPYAYLEATFASGRAPEGLALLIASNSSQTVKEFIQRGHLVSLGELDACRDISGMHYCTTNVGESEVPSVQSGFGMCVPSACDSDDVNSVIRSEVIQKLNTTNPSMAIETLQELVAAAMDSLVLTTHCDNISYPYTTGTYLALILLMSLVLCVAIGTFLDSELYQWMKDAWESRRRRNQGLPPLPPQPPANSLGYARLESEDEGFWPTSPARTHNIKGGHKSDDPLVVQCFKCFSLYTNIRLLLAPSRGRTFDVLDGMRVLSTSWLLLGHVTSFGQPFFGNQVEINAYNGKGYVARWFSMIIVGSSFSLDTFFVIGGFMASRLLIDFLVKPRCKNKTMLLYMKEGEIRSSPKTLLCLAVLFLRHYLHLTPAYAFILVFYIYLLPVLTTGPFWGSSFAVNRQLCMDDWWKNLLYIENLVEKDGRSCYGVTWYLANAMQFRVIVPLFVLIYLANKKAGYATTFLVAAASVAFAFVDSYHNEWHFTTQDHNQHNTDYMSYYYSKPWMRVPPYLVGVLLAFLWRDYESYRKKTGEPRAFSPAFGFLLLVASSGLLGMLVFDLHWAYQDTPSPISQLAQSSVIAFAKPAWAIAVAVLCFLLFDGYGGYLKDFLDTPLFAITNRLCYCAYLVHPMVLYWYYAEQSRAVRFDGCWYTMLYSGLCSIVFVLGAVLYLLVEKPVSNLDHLFMAYLQQKKVLTPTLGGGGSDEYQDKPLTGQSPSMAQISGAGDLDVMDV